MSSVVSLLVVVSLEPHMAQAFSIAPRTLVGGLVRPSSPTTILHMTKPTTTKPTMTKPTIAKRSDLDKGPAKQMDELIFNFNKVLIDSVYDLIW